MAASTSRRWMILAAGLTLTLPAHAFDFGKMLKDVISQPASQSSTSGVDALSNADINAGLKEALTRGADAAPRSSHAIRALGTGRIGRAVGGVGLEDATATHGRA